MNSFSSLDPLIQSFVSAAREALAVQIDFTSRLKIGIPVSTAQKRQLAESWNCVQREIDRLSWLFKAQGSSCVVAGCLNAQFLRALELFRHAYCRTEQVEITQDIYQQCMAARDAYLSHADSHKCVTP